MSDRINALSSPTAHLLEARTNINNAALDFARLNKSVFKSTISTLEFLAKDLTVAISSIERKQNEARRASR